MELTALNNLGKKIGVFIGNQWIETWVAKQTYILEA